VVPITSGMAINQVAVIPVGMSPVHCLRLVRRFSGNHISSIILAVSDETENYGERICELCENLEAEVLTCDYKNISTLISNRKEIKEWNLMFGPGTRDMGVSLWFDIVSSTGFPPKNWVQHSRKANSGKGRNISGESLVGVFDHSTKYQLEQVSLEDSLHVYSVSMEDYLSYPELNWSEDETIFQYRIIIPENAKSMDKKKVRKWEEEVFSTIQSLRKLFGKHAIKFSRTLIPSGEKLEYWSTVGSRMRDHGIRGGSA